MASVKKAGPAWGAVVIWMILFWPVGLFLLYRKLTADKTAVLRNSRTLSILGWVFLAVGVTQAPAVFAEYQAGPVVVFVLFFFGGGLAMIINASKIKKTGDKYRRYIEVIANQHLMSIDSIAAAIPAGYEETVENLRKMIDIGYFAGAHIDTGRGELIMPSQQMIHVDLEAEAAAAISAGSTKVVTCRSCGANNTIRIGAVSECEYCGSPLE